MSEELVDFYVYHKVVGSQRPRFYKNHAYIPQATREYRDVILDKYQAMHFPKFSGPISVWIDVFRTIPKSRPKSVIHEPDTFKPDADNIAKSVLDALNGTAYDDDSQVCVLFVKKHDRARVDEHIRVRIKSLS